MNRKDKSLFRRVVSTICAFALIGAVCYSIFVGMNAMTGAVLAVALVGICAPVIVAGGSIIEVLSGVFEAFIDGLMGVVDAISSIFSL